MKEALIKTLSNGIYGNVNHIDPREAVKGLTPAIARIKPENKLHSCWDILHHIVVWQEGMLEAIKGNKVDWNDIEKNHNWPSSELLSDDSNFTSLMKKFEDYLAISLELTKTLDLNKPMPAWGDKPVFQGLFTLIQHNSYHLGQLITTRKILGQWPS